MKKKVTKKNRTGTKTATVRNWSPTKAKTVANKKKKKHHKKRNPAQVQAKTRTITKYVQAKPNKKKNPKHAQRNPGRSLLSFANPAFSRAGVVEIVRIGAVGLAGGFGSRILASAELGLAERFGLGQYTQYPVVRPILTGLNAVTLVPVAARRFGNERDAQNAKYAGLLFMAADFFDMFVGNDKVIGVEDKARALFAGHSSNGNGQVQTAPNTEVVAGAAAQAALNAGYSDDEA